MWISELADKAENILIKIDQNAAALTNTADGVETSGLNTKAKSLLLSPQKLVRKAVDTIKAEPEPWEQKNANSIDDASLPSRYCHMKLTYKLTACY